MRISDWSSDVCSSDLCLAYIDNGGISVDELMEIVPAPDFPTGALILGRSGARSAYQTGRGSIIVRSRHVIEENRGDRRSILLTEIPFQQGKNARSEEHTSELQSLMRISYAVFCLKKKKK